MTGLISAVVPPVDTNRPIPGSSVAEVMAQLREARERRDAARGAARESRGLGVAGW